MSARLATLSLYVAALILMITPSLVSGAEAISPAVAWDALVAFDDKDYAHYVIGMQRLPGTMIAGAAVAISGAILQVLARNPLADLALRLLGPVLPVPLSLTLVTIGVPIFVITLRISQARREINSGDPA